MTILVFLLLRARMNSRSVAKPNALDVRKCDPFPSLGFGFLSMTNNLHVPCIQLVNTQKTATVTPWSLAASPEALGGPGPATTHGDRMSSLKTGRIPGTYNAGVMIGFFLLPKHQGFLFLGG